MTMHALPVAEAETTAYLAELFHLEQDPATERATITVGPFSAFILIAALQLATRHPDMSQTHLELLAQIIGQIKPLFADTLGEVLLNLGDNPEYDQPSGPA